MATTTFPARLRHLAFRLLAIGAAAGVCWGVTAAMLVLLNGAWLDLLWEMPPRVRVVCSALAAAAVLALITGALTWARRRGTPQFLAQELDRVAGSGGQIRSGVDLALAPAPASTLSVGLADLAVRHAETLSASIPGSRAVPARPLWWSLGGLSLLTAGVAVLVLVMPRLAYTQWLRFSDPYGDHPPYSRVAYHVEPGDVQVIYGQGLDIRVTTEGAAVERVDLVVQPDEGAAAEMVPMFPEADGGWRATVAQVTAPGQYHVRSHAGRSKKFRIGVTTVPRLEQVRFRVTPPAYTNHQPYEGPLPQGGLSGLPGTRVQIWAKSNRPLSSGSVRVPPTDSNAVKLEPLSPGSQEVSGTFEIAVQGKMRLWVTDTDDQRSLEEFVAPVNLLADERPFIRLLEPPAQSLATPHANLPIVLAAEDDYGIARIQLFRSLNDSRAMPLDVPVPLPPRTRFTETVVLPLETYGLLPGDEIKLFGRVEDNDPAGPKGAESPLAVVRIISQDDFERMLRQREGLEVLLNKYQQALRRMESAQEETDRLRKKAREKPPEQDADKEFRDELEKLADRLQKDADDLRKSAAKKMPYDLDQHLSKELAKLAQQLEAAAQSARTLSRQPGLKNGKASEALAKLQKQLEGDRLQYEQQVMEGLEHLASLFPLLEEQARFISLYERQKELAERLRSLKGRDKEDSPQLKARMRDLQQSQQEIRAELENLLDRIEDHVAKLPEDRKLDKLRESAREFVKAARASGAAEAMTEAESGLAEFSGTRGHAGAQKAAEALEKLISQCNGMGGEGMLCLRFSPSLSAGLGNTIEQLLGEMGFGNGQGNGNGYSARSNSLANMGLYGSMPTSLSGDRGGSSRSASPRGSGARGRSDRAEATSAEAASKSSAAGAADASVPPSYRRRVAEYFQRIADETSSK